MAFESGPYVQIAAFCERVLEEKDGVLSLIRIIDRLTHTATGADAPSDMPPLNYQMSLVLALKNGQARGSHDLRVVRELPSGIREESEAPTFRIPFEGEGDRGQNLVLQLQLTFPLEGLYWFDVFLDDQVLTRIPFRVVYARISQGAPR
jgi:hypothetical protein